MRCLYCADFDYDQLASEAGYRHHRNWHELLVSARNGCLVCKLVVQLSRDSRPDEEPRWEDEEQSRQIVCRLAGDSIVWTYGSIQRSQVSICTGYDDPLSRIIHSRPVFESVFHPASLETMRLWLRRCDEEHPACPANEDRRLPTRVIDVGSPTEPPFLVISRGQFGKWVALSHCWGRRLPIKTELATFKEHCESIQLDRLTPTFRDAIRITRELGIQYLWIDALCIIQDSDEDWLAESATMDHVYQNAAFTIAAEAAPDSATGIVGSMKDHRHSGSQLLWASCHSHSRRLQGKIHFRVDNARFKGGTSRGPLSKRGWTMQEEILSPRILRFTEQQVLWRCPSTHFREWSPQVPHRRSDFIKSLYERVADVPDEDEDYEMLPPTGVSKSLLHFWYTGVVNQYVGRQLTFQTDRLIAVAGLIKEMQKNLDVPDSVAGLWREDMHAGLSWLAPVANAQPHDEYIAPSWSWAQLNLPSAAQSEQSLYDEKIIGAFTPMAKILDITLQKASSVDSKNDGQRWALRIQGQYCTVCSCKMPVAFFDQRHTASEDYYYHLDRVANPVNNFISSIGLERLVTKQCSSPRSDKHQSYLYLQLGRWEPNPHKPNSNDEFLKPVIVALVLKEVGTKVDAGRYKRAGRAFIPTDPLEHLVCPVKTVVVV